jgi:hypothetical protein
MCRHTEISCKDCRYTHAINELCRRKKYAEFVSDEEGSDYARCLIFLEHGVDRRVVGRYDEGHDCGEWKNGDSREGDAKH